MNEAFAILQECESNLRKRFCVPRPLEQVLQNYGLNLNIVSESECRARFEALIPVAKAKSKSGRETPVDGFFLSGDHPQVVVSSASGTGNRLRFTIAHELGHLILHKFTEPHADGRLQVRFRDEESSKGRVHEEIQANQFAAELLMPERFVRALVNNSDIADEKSDDGAVEQLKLWAKRFEVSAQALSLRIANLSSLNF